MPMRTTCDQWSGTATACLLALAALIGHTAGAQTTSPAGPPLPPDDQRTLERYLGANVVGAPVTAPPIDDPAAWFGLRPGVWTGLRSGGKGDEHVTWDVKQSDGDDDASWRCEMGTIVRFIATTDNGSIDVVSEIDHHQGVVSRFTPGERRLTSGLTPGASEAIDVAVKVYDLKHPDHLEHSGKLELTNTYVGAYQVHVPAGTYEAVLVRSHFKGKVGPADIEDTTYHLYAKDVGIVAYVEIKNISAMLLYHDDTKVGFVLQERKARE